MMPTETETAKAARMASGDQFCRPVEKISHQQGNRPAGNNSDQTAAEAQQDGFQQKLLENIMA